MIGAGLFSSLCGLVWTPAASLKTALFAALGGEHLELHIIKHALKMLCIDSHCQKGVKMLCTAGLIIRKRVKVNITSHLFSPYAITYYI